MSARNSPTTKADLYRFEVLQNMLIGKFYELLDELGIKCNWICNNRVTVPCPIHGGNNGTAFNINTPDHEYPGKYKCWTHHCENTFKSSLLGLIRGCLSHDQHGWTEAGDSMVKGNIAINWACEFLGIRWSDIKYDARRAEQDEFVKKFRSTEGNDSSLKAKITREQVRQHLEIPAEYYLGRGYSAEILDKYDVGVCNRPGKEMYKRTVFPIYHDGYFVGATGRSLCEECPKCGFYHEGVCTSERRYPKWRMSAGFDKSRFLYNFDLGLTRNKRSIIILESPGNVLRLEDAGICGSVATFGSSLSPDQQALLDRAGVMTLIVCYDADEAGKKGMEDIKRKYGSYYRIFYPSLMKDGQNDLADLSTDEITRDVKPTLDKIIERC
jgi:hypothetical protein